MESLIISLSRLQTIVVSAFLAKRFDQYGQLYDWMADKHCFRIKIIQKNDPPSPNDVFEINRDVPEMVTLDADAMISYLEGQLLRFMEQVNDKRWFEISGRWTLREQGDNFPFQASWHSLEAVPRNPIEGDNKKDYSDDVLIDIDGNRKFFHVGWFDHSERKWRFRDADTPEIDLEHGKWCLLPLSEYDK